MEFTNLKQFAPGERYFWNASPEEDLPVSYKGWFRILSGDGALPGVYNFVESDPARNGLSGESGPRVLWGVDAQASVGVWTGPVVGEIPTELWAKNIVLVGHSLSEIESQLLPIIAPIRTAPEPEWQLIRNTVYGQTTSYFDANAATLIDQYYDSERTENVLLAVLARNDIISGANLTGEQAIEAMETFFANRIAAGWPVSRIGTFTVTPSVVGSNGATEDFEARRTVINDWLRDPARIGAQFGFLVDLAAEPEAGDPADTDYYTDGCHYTAALRTIAAQLAWDAVEAATAGPPPDAPVIDSDLSVDITPGAAFSYNITATNTPTSYSASGLPSGLSINTSTGEIAGTIPGSYEVTIGAQNAGGLDTETLTISVASGGEGGGSPQAFLRL